LTTGAALLASAVLVGCSAAPAGHTPAELQEYVDLQNMSQWAAQQEQYTIPEKRPEVAVKRFINADEFRVVYECMADAGVPVEFGDDGGISWSTGAGTQDEVELIRYTCNAQYPFYPPQIGHFTDEQHAYLYDYYQDVLIPCLLLEGYRVSDAAPTRAEFNDLATIDSFWSPYEFIDYPLDYTEFEALYATCPSVPFRAPVAD